MLGQMMDMPLSISILLVHADRFHGDTEIVSRRVEGDIHRYTYRDAHRRSRQAASALETMNIARGGRVATLAWNGYRHFELYYGISGSGRVMHTIKTIIMSLSLSETVKPRGNLHHVCDASQATS